MAQPVIDLAALGGAVGSVDDHAASALGQRAGDPAQRPALGRLLEMIEWLASVQGPRQRPFRRVVLVSATPAPADIRALADAAGVLVRELDPGSDENALQAAVDAADDEVDRGTDLAVLAGTSAGLAPVVAISVLTGSEPVQVLARGAAACAPDEWMSRAAEIRDTRRRVNGLRDRPGELLGALQCPSLTSTTGFVLRAIARRTPLVLDGVLALAAGLVAQRAAPGAADWLQVADTAPEPAQHRATAALGRRPLLELGIGRDDGLAGLLAVPVLRAAVTLGSEGQPG